MSGHYLNLRAVLLKHLLGLEPDADNPFKSEWERFRAQAVAEFLPDAESARLTQRTLAELDQRSPRNSRF
jgi:hypothetical protein